MIEWIMKFFTKKELRNHRLPKCSKCGLVSHKKIKIEFIEDEQISTITGNCCNSCEEELSREFNPLWIPPLVLKEK
ncbi:MAG: hypothetical protein GOVbin4206_36 [Prokaryotic dsDNA virus sp.]|nr:MAG: hypothetical protein GOVbin4206_36 [Prokaryotic dsDNA virus sp.]|tara:strand:+ start:361 stop:588 length:228 start_codon:yes stop_codon:yes gene_type:complete